METLSTAAQDDSSGANPSSVKSDDSSPRHEGGRGSPPPNCAICLGTCRNKSFTDSCLHQFCFKCLLTWSKVKAECPLCKQNFRSIIHNVQSNHQYEEYMVEQRTEEVTERIDIENLAVATRRFRYRTTLTLPRRSSMAIQQLLLQYPLVADVLPPRPARRRSPAAFRRTVYRHNLWARPLPDFTGRFRDCTPEFYRYNDSQMHRLVPWLNRELHYLLNENVGHISYVLTRILELLPQFHITSTEFREAVQRYFGERTEHFLHELFCFASTPYDMTGYDRNVQYTTDTRISAVVNEVFSSSDSDSADSDILIVSEPPAGPSRPQYPGGYVPRPPPPQPAGVIPIETISHSDTDDSSSEVTVVGYIKPPHERTPEVVDLAGSDSDVVVHEPPEPPPALVRVSLKRPRSESERSAYTPPPRRRRSATTSDTSRSTPPPSPSCPSSTFTPPSPATSTNTSDLSFNSFISSDTTSSSSDDQRRRRPLRKKSKRKSRREDSERRRSKRRASSRARRRAKRSPSRSETQRDKRSKRKSHSGKGVKSSKRRGDVEAREPPSEPARPGPAETRPGPAETRPGPAEPRPGTAEPQPGPSGAPAQRRPSHETKRLKSVVNVILKQSSDTSRSPTLNSYVNNLSPHHTNCQIQSSTVKDERSQDPGANFVMSVSKVEKTEPSWSSDDDDTDSEDNLPLNLTMQKMFSRST